MTGLVSVFVTVGSREEAEKIAHTMVEENLAACANFVPAIWSIYRWQGKIEESEECALIFKTSAQGFEALQKRIKEIHTYECPCIVAWPIVAGNPGYLDWLRQNAPAS